MSIINLIFNEILQYDLISFSSISYEKRNGIGIFSQYIFLENTNYIIFDKKNKSIKYFKLDNGDNIYSGSYSDCDCYIIHNIHNFDYNTFYQIFYNFCKNYSSLFIKNTSKYYLYFEKKGNFYNIKIKKNLLKNSLELNSLNYANYLHNINNTDNEFIIHIKI